MRSEDLFSSAERLEFNRQAVRLVKRKVAVPDLCRSVDASADAFAHERALQMKKRFGEVVATIVVTVVASPNRVRAMLLGTLRAFVSASSVVDRGGQTRCTPMTYSAEISRDHPTAFLFVIDQSESMEDPIAGGRSKAEFVADVLNKTLYTLVTNCSKADGVRPYFDIGVLSYSGDGIADGFGHVANGHAIICPITDVANTPLRIEHAKRR